VLERELGANLPEGTTAIAHTRWATHGAPNTVNAHPHADCGGTLALVHNGIIENSGALRQALTKRGHVFRSQTDTEVLSHLIEETHTKGTPLVEATAAALREVEGTYGIAVISSREPDTIVARAADHRCWSPSATARTSSHRMPRRCWRIHAPSSISMTARSPK